MAETDAQHLRRTGDGAFVRSESNPGIRVEPDFVSEAEAELLASEIAATADTYGYSYDGDTVAHSLAGDGEIASTHSDRVNNIRVTGRLLFQCVMQRNPKTSELAELPTDAHILSHVTSRLSPQEIAALGCTSSSFCAIHRS